MLEPRAQFAPTLLILNARVHTLDPALPRAEAVAIYRDRVAAVGSTKDLQDLAGHQTRVIDAERALVLPGFNDAHVHFLMGGFSLGSVHLRSSRSPEEMAERLRQQAARLPRGHWILGGEWDHECWPGAPEPTRQMIDHATPEHPVFVHRLDVHMVLANSLALELAGITRGTPDVPGGVIVRDPITGEPTGLLKDAAASLVARVIPPHADGDKLSAAQAATRYAASLGVTSVTDVSADADLGLYQEMERNGELKTRIYGARSIVSWEVAAQAGYRAGFGSSMVRTGLVKGFADGSLGSTTALFFEPYEDAPNQRGLLFEQMLPEGIMLKRALAADRHGLQLAIHAIGDEANCHILDLFEEVARQNGVRDRRARIEHAQHLRPQEIPRFGKTGVIASMQPYHAADDGRWCGRRLGPRRSQTAYAFRSLLDRGAVLAFGSDWTVAPLNPLTGIKAAVTRQTLDGHYPEGWIPEQKITLAEALHGYTTGAAFAEFSETQKGTITPGKLADLVFLDRDLFRIPPSDIDQARVIRTVVGGEVVYEA